MHRHALAILTLATSALVNPVRANSPARSLHLSTPFTLNAHKQIVVSITVNGTGPWPFVLDTGSSHTSIVESLAGRLGARPVARAVVTTAVGARDSAIVQVDRLELGTVRNEGLLATLVPDHAVGEPGSALGILGQDFLSAANYTLDFGDRRVEWNPDMSRHGGQRLPLRWKHDRFVVDLEQDDGILELVPDSGTEALVLFDRGTNRIPPHERTGAKVGLDTVTNRGAAAQIRVLRLRLGRLCWLNEPAVVVERRGDFASSADGLLPLSRFARVTFDGRDKTIVFEDAE